MTSDPWPKAKELYLVTESASRKHVEDIQAKQADLPAIDWDAYAKDVDGRFGDAKAKDMEIKELKDEVLEEVRLRKESHDRDTTFFRNLPEARQMTYEMYLEAFPNSAKVVPKMRDETETALETVQANLDVFAKKREERKNYQ